jgi:DNA repair exonuclease SbcCD nuclease subunit
MRFVHFSDTHLGFSDLSIIDPGSGMNQREKDFYTAWRRAIDKILELRPDFVVHAGDLFQSPRPNNRAISTAIEGIRKLGSAGIPFVVVSGNHSTPRIPQTGSIFESLALLPNVHAAYRSKYECFKIGDCAIHCIPHCTPADALAAACAAISTDPEARYQILVAHAAWRHTGGSVAGSAGEFNEQIIDDPATHTDVAFDYIALGHYHKYLEVAPNTFYSGSIERTSFDEIGFTSGIIPVDLEKKSHQYLELPSRPMLSIGPVRCDEMAAEEIYKEIEKQGRSLPEGCLLRLVLEGISRDTLRMIDIQQIDARLSKALYVEKVLNPSRDHALELSTVSIGALPVEFERYMEAQDDFTLDREKFLSLGLALLDKADTGKQ